MAVDSTRQSMVTATRRRPQRFCDLVGQEFVAATLENSIKRSQIANAYLFSGPRGCGKTSSARIMAKALNCKAGDTPQVTPCGVCESCRAIASSSSMDVIEIDGASNTSVNDVRAIKDEVMFPPNFSRYKIYIIDEVHMLSTSAFNALLKTIEEPPPYVVFIFATTELQKVPATIKSRCQQFNFRLVSTEKIKNLLADAATELKITYEDEALYWVAKESGGSVRDSYTLFDQVVSFSDGNITYEKIRDKLGLVGVEALNSLMGYCCTGDSKGALNLLDEMLSAGVSVDTIIAGSVEYLRSILLIKNGITKESLLSAALTRYDTNVLQSWSTTQVERALSIFLQLYRNTRYTINARFELELSFSLLSSLKEYVSPADVKKALDATAGILLSQTTQFNDDNPGYQKEQVTSPTIPQDNNTNTPTIIEKSYSGATAASRIRQSIGITKNDPLENNNTLAQQVKIIDKVTPVKDNFLTTNQIDNSPNIDNTTKINSEDAKDQNNSFNVDIGEYHGNITTVESDNTNSAEPADDDDNEDDANDDDGQKVRYTPPMKKHNILKSRFDGLVIE